MPSWELKNFHREGRYGITTMKLVLKERKIDYQVKELEKLSNAASKVRASKDYLHM